MLDVDESDGSIPAIDGGLNLGEVLRAAAHATVSTRTPALSAAQSMDFDSSTIMRPGSCTR